MYINKRIWIGLAWLLFFFSMLFFLAGINQFEITQLREFRVNAGLVFVSVVFFLAALYLYRVTNRIHPAIRKYHVIELDPSRLKQLADSQEAFFIDVGPKVIELLLKPNPVFDDGCETVELGEEIKERRTAVTISSTYAGVVVGEEKTSEVRFSITDNLVDGYILQDKDWWFVEPLKKFKREAGPNEFLVYNTKDVSFKLEYGHDTLPEKVEQGDGGVDPPHRVNPIIGIAVLADREYNQQAGWTGTSWWRQQAGLINSVNGVYQRELGCEFRVRLFILDLRTTSLTSTNADRLLDQIENPINLVIGDLRRLTVRQSQSIEIAYLTSGKNLDGNSLGIAWRPGVYGLSQNQLIWVGGGGGLFGGPPNLGFQNMMIAAHEIGHNFNGVHSEADKWCVAHFIWCWDYVRSIMWASYHGDNRAEFSDGSRNSSDDNAERIQTNMSSGRNRNF